MLITEIVTHAFVPFQALGCFEIPTFALPCKSARVTSSQASKYIDGRQDDFESKWVLQDDFSNSMMLEGTIMRLQGRSITLFSSICMLNEAGNKSNSNRNYTMLILIAEHCIDTFKLKTRVKQYTDIIIMEWVLATK
jgi:hypothetical protein